MLQTISTVLLDKKQGTWWDIFGSFENVPMSSTRLSGMD